MGSACEPSQNWDTADDTFQDEQYLDSLDILTVHALGSFENTGLVWQPRKQLSELSLPYAHICC